MSGSVSLKGGSVWCAGVFVSVDSGSGRYKVGSVSFKGGSDNCNIVGLVAS
jgi:hypothetical protein